MTSTKSLTTGPRIPTWVYTAGRVAGAHVDAREEASRIIRISRSRPPQDRLLSPAMKRAAVFTLLAALFACVAVSHAAEREFYWNQVSNATQWEEPAVPVPYQDEESGKQFYVDPKTGESTWEVSTIERRGCVGARVPLPHPATSPRKIAGASFKSTERLVTEDIFSWHVPIVDSSTPTHPTRFYRRVRSVQCARDSSQDANAFARPSRLHRFAQFPGKWKKFHSEDHGIDFYHNEVSRALEATQAPNENVVSHSCDRGLSGLYSASRVIFRAHPAVGSRATRLSRLHPAQRRSLRSVE